VNRLKELVSRNLYAIFWRAAGPDVSTKSTDWSTSLMVRTS